MTTPTTVPMVTIPEEEYKRLLADSEWLFCLEDAGVDNWSGIDYAASLRIALRADKKLGAKND